MSGTPLRLARAPIRFARLEGPDRALLLRAILLLWKRRLGLWLRPFRMPEEAARVPDSEIPIGPGSRPSPLRIAWAVNAAARLVPRATCLVRALAARELCHRFGYPATLRLGARRDCTGDLEAHAWLELAGEVVVGGDGASAAYSVFRPGGRGGEGDDASGSARDPGARA
jgi:hypothetical protein